MARADRARSRLALTAICSVLFLTFLDNTIVSVALANIQTSLHAGVTGLQWIVDGYMVAFAGLMLAGGTLGDLLGRRRVMLGGVAIFCGGGIIAATAGSSSALIAGRVVMGVGAAACEPGTLSLIRQLYPDARPRARALGVWTAVSGVSLAAGPVLGGVLVDTWSWRAVFWFNVIFGFAAFAVAALTVRESADPHGRTLDIPGLITGALAVVSVTFAIIEGESYGYRTIWVLALFVVAGLSSALFVRCERRSSDPMLDLSVISRVQVAIPLIVGFVTSFGLFAVFFFVALYLQVIVGRSGADIALQFAAMSVAMVVAGIAAGSWTAARGPRLPMALGCGIAAAGIFAVDAQIGPTVGAAQLAVSLAIVGVGLGFALVAVTTSVLESVTPERSGMAASALNTSRELGGVLAVAILGAVVNGRLVSHLNDRLGGLGLPAELRRTIVDTVTTGRYSLSSSAENPLVQGNLSVFTKIIGAAEAAFGDGLHVALIVAGVILTAAAILALLGVRPREQNA